MTCATSEAGITYTSVAPEFIPVFFSGVCVAQSLVFYVVFCRSLFVLFLCVVSPSLNYGFWLPLWYLQTFLTDRFHWYVISIPTCL